MTNKSVCLVLPVPPSVNAAYRNVAGRGRARTEAYLNWLSLADGALLQQKRHITPLRGKCVLSIRIPSDTRGDISNRIKVCEDWLVAREITGDDKHNDEVTIKRDPSLDGYCVVTVTPVDGEGPCE